MKIEWTEPAFEDLENIQEYIAKDSIFYALQFTHRILEAAESLESFPERGRKVPEASDIRDEEQLIRELIFQQHYRIIYRISYDKDVVEIIAAIHCSRDLSRVDKKPWEI